MVALDFSPKFEKTLKKIRDHGLKDKLKKQIEKIIKNPETGKPMKYARKGTREVYIPPFRPSYSYIQNENKIVFLALYHKDEQ
ncbi:type II toxin-antitoxin system RelE/ParE family toxin [Candidatus Woesearchaeota archaeon]|nr:type II toxin-antitoxin system RelE/ParE family toxin [Candidatus Woesearchaeota archaeon]